MELVCTRVTVCRCQHRSQSSCSDAAVRRCTAFEYLTELSGSLSAGFGALSFAHRRPRADLQLSCDQALESASVESCVAAHEAQHGRSEHGAACSTTRPTVLPLLDAPRAVPRPPAALCSHVHQRIDGAGSRGAFKPVEAELRQRCVPCADGTGAVGGRRRWMQQLKPSEPRGAPLAGTTRRGLKQHPRRLSR